MINQRGFVWLDESQEHTEQEEARAEALANKWSSLHHDAEQRQWAHESDIEDGRDDGGPEPDPCETCGGDSYLLPESYPRMHNGTAQWGGCDQPNCTGLVNIKCTNPHCVDGYDIQAIHEAEHRRQVQAAERRLEIELVEDKLAAIGARMMRPYEHWNEDEQYMQYMEEGRFGHHSG